MRKILTIGAILAVLAMATLVTTVIGVAESKSDAVIDEQIKSKMDAQLQESIKMKQEKLNPPPPTPDEISAGIAAGIVPLGSFISGQVSNGGSVNHQISIPPGRTQLRAGLLWNEFSNDLDLYLIDPSGSTRCSSLAVGTLTEECAVTSNIQSGTWILRVYGYNVPTTWQSYYAAYDTD